MKIYIFIHVLHMSWSKMLFNNMKKKKQEKMKKALKDA